MVDAFVCDVLAVHAEHVGATLGYTGAISTQVEFQVWFGASAPGLTQISNREEIVGKHSQKIAVALALVRSGHAMRTGADKLGVHARTWPRLCRGAQQRRGRRPEPDAALLAEIKAIIAELPTYGYRRVHACCVVAVSRVASQR